MAAIVTVVETVTFVARAKGGMTDDERHRAIDMIAADPECGVRIPGGGGLRKVRFGVGGRGKRGGVRIVYYYQDLSMPVFLLTVFAKNERDDLSRRELNQLAGAAKQIARTYGG
jgi:hypothetical protein